MAIYFVNDAPSFDNINKFLELKFFLLSTNVKSTQCKTQ